MPKFEEASKEWFAYAERDFYTAEHISKTMHPVPLEIVCYHCQQSSEKFLKGFIARKGKSVQKTHDLRILLIECIKENLDFKALESECARLSPYGVQSRYPFAIEIEETDMHVALADAKKIMSFVKSTI